MSPDIAASILAPAMEPGCQYRGTDEVFDLAGLDFTLVSAEEVSDLDSGIDQVMATVQVGAETWDDMVIPADAHVIPLDTDGNPVAVSADFRCAECGTGVAETFVVTTLDYADVRGTRTEVCLHCHEVSR
jgi:hypothetical protein